MLHIAICAKVSCDVLSIVLRIPYLAETAAEPCDSEASSELLGTFGCRRDEHAQGGHHFTKETLDMSAEAQALAFVDNHNVQE